MSPSQRTSKGTSNTRRILLVASVVLVFAMAIVEIQWSLEISTEGSLSFTPGRSLVAPILPALPMRTTTKIPKDTLAIADVQSKNSAPVPVKSTEPFDCFPHNSKEWLEGPRIGNQDEPLMNDGFVKQMTLQVPYMLAEAGKAKPYLSQSIAFENSRFLDDKESATNAKSIRLWTVRLVYLSILYHQHSPAIPEVEAVYRDETNTQKCLAEREARGIGRYDYECPKKRFIVAGFSNNGLGANIRSGAVTQFLAGLASDRIVLFINNSPVGDKFITAPWKLASCDRHDAQCFFLPTTPCTLTNQDLSDAYSLTQPEQRKLIKQGKKPDGHEDDKVWYMAVSLMPPLFSHKVTSPLLHSYAKGLIDAVPGSDPRLPVLKSALDHLLEEDPRREGEYNYAASNHKVNHALGFYGMRPNLEYTEKIKHVLDEIVPEGFDAENSFGLPIRASDKCLGESECLSFYQHMEATTVLWKRHQNVTNAKSDPSVVFTTEAKGMVMEQEQFDTNATLRKSLSFDYTFLTNHKDVTPDTGFVKDLRRKKTNFTADESMLSAVTSLKFQLLPRVSLGNCCSNFHVLLGDFLMEGLGAASDNTFKCLQEFEDPRLKVCCGWHKQCKKDRAQALAVLANQTAVQ